MKKSLNYNLNNLSNNDNDNKLSLPQQIYQRNQATSSNSSLNSPFTNTTTSSYDSQQPITPPQGYASPELEIKKKKGLTNFLWTNFFSSKNKNKNENEIQFKGPRLEDKYLIKKRIIARGTTGIIGLVTLKEEKELKQSRVLVVKKFLKPKRNESYELIELKVGNEYCISSGLNHPNIIKVYDLVQDNEGYWCQIMEYCPGGDLCHIIMNGIMNKPEINCLFQQLIEGINYLHKMGIAHGDIKPDNLLIDKEGKLKLTDFGCAISFCNDFKNSFKKDKVIGLRGSLPYMAPEFFLIDEEVNSYDAKLIDIWSCGIVYLTLLNGDIPFNKADNSDYRYLKFLKSKKEQLPIDLFKNMDKEAINVISKLLEPEPLKRLNINEIMNSFWFQSLEVCFNGQAKTTFHHHFALNYHPSH